VLIWTPVLYVAHGGGGLDDFAFVGLREVGLGECSRAGEDAGDKQ
jgi:hypothetical protein